MGVSGLGPEVWGSLAVLFPRGPRNVMVSHLYTSCDQSWRGFELLALLFGTEGAVVFEELPHS